MISRKTFKKRQQLSSLAGFIVLMAGQIAFAENNAINSPNFATQLSNENVAALQRKGPDAIGGIGDWFITNGTLCAVISDVDHEGEFSVKGGSLIDLGYCGQADDHFTFTHDLLNGSRRRSLDTEKISIAHINGQQSIVVEAKSDGATLKTRYYFEDGKKTQLQIQKRYDYAPGESVNFISPLNFNYHSLEPFVFSSRNTLDSNGFQNQDFVKRGVSAIGDSARYADTLITISPRSANVGISYGWKMLTAQRVEDASREDVPFFMLADTDGTAMMVLTDTFYIGDGTKVGWFQLPQIPLLELDQGSALETHEVVYVGKRGDVASVTDQMLNTSATVRGKINSPDTAIHVIQSNGAPLTHVIPESDGTFKFNAPPGKYSLNAFGYGARSLKHDFDVSTGSVTELGQLSLSSAAKLSLPQGEAMRLVFVGLNNTPNPDFAGSLTQSSVAFDDEIKTAPPISAVFLAGVDGDKKAVDIAAGTYRVYATKGPEFSLEQQEITLRQGEAQTLNIDIPQRVLSTPGYIASDLHVHSGLSFDNTFAESERVRTFTAEHGEVMVSSEHDLPTDYTPYIEDMGVKGKIVSISGAEVTSTLPTSLNPYTGGHINFFPYEAKHHHFRNGMVNHENKRLRETMHAIREDQPASVVQLNHPRYDLRLSSKDLPSDWEDIVDNGNYLDHMGSAGHPYNPYHELSAEHNNVLIEPHPHTGVRDIDFDLIEVVNPGGGNHYDRLTAVRRDWLSFLKQGELIVGTANSDSHNALEQVAIPRTMVAMSDDRVSHFNQEEFINNLKAGNAYGTTGPMLNVSLLDAKMGDTFSGRRAPLKVSISKAPWIKLDRLEIQINGKTIDTHALNDELTQEVLIPLEFDRDSFVMIEVFGPPTPDYAAVYPEISPYAFSNPIFVDFDQDGKWQAPGL